MLVDVGNESSLDSGHNVSRPAQGDAHVDKILEQMLAALSDRAVPQHALKLVRKFERRSRRTC